MHLDAFKQLKIGQKLITLGTISSSKGVNKETFIVPAGTTITVRNDEIFYVESIDDYYVICDVEYNFIGDSFYQWGRKKLPKKLGQVAVNPADVILSES